LRTQIDRIIGFVACAFIFCSIVSLAAADAPRYEITQPNRDGIGKWYMGRSISHVMGHRGAAWLERSSRQQEERTDLLISNLPLTEQSVVADVGAGTGYFTFPVAARVPAGRVYAVDIQNEMLNFISERQVRQSVTNVEGILGTVNSINLPENVLDLAFIVDAYHEFSHPYEMGQSIFNALKPGGKLVLVEYRGEDPTVPIKRLHKMTVAQARKEMSALGFLWSKNIDVLPQQHLMIFVKPSDTDIVDQDLS